MSAPRLILASSSTFRRSQLTRFGWPFTVCSPDVDETAHLQETARALVERLSLAKARVVADQVSDGLVIGSDQVAVIDGEILGKPGSRPAAIGQLQRSSGREVVFLTGLALVNASSGRTQFDIARTEVGYRSLSNQQIEQYLDRDEPYQCAGSIRSEQLGIAMFRYQRSDDPSALVGLPLARLAQMLMNEGLDVLAPPPM